jgi:hypothetical protein
MESEDIKWLSEANKDRFNQLEEVFSLPGWKLLVEWAEQKAIDAGVRGANAATWEDNRQQLGSRLVYEEIVALRDASYNEFEVIALQARLDSEEADMDAFE